MSSGSGMCAYREMAVDLMVIPRSCSSFLVSVKRLLLSVSALSSGDRHIRFAGLGGRDDTSSLDERVGESRLAVIDVSCHVLVLFNVFGAGLGALCGSIRFQNISATAVGTTYR